jgi:hypothetical protein
MAEAIGAACASLGVPVEARPWRPHLTLARVREGEREIGRVLATAGMLDRPTDVGPLQVNEIAMMESQLQPDGPVHTTLWTVALLRGFYEAEPAIKQDLPAGRSSFYARSFRALPVCAADCSPRMRVAHGEVLSLLFALVVDESRSSGIR